MPAAVGKLSCGPSTFSILPEKAGATGRGRRIVYLDQNVLSDLAKLRLGRLPAGERTVALRELADALHEAVFKRQTARCVESFFHQEESSNLSGAGGHELFREIWKFLVVHSWNLKLLGHEEIIRFQTLVSIATEIGIVEYDRRYLWRGAFSGDPNASNDAAGVAIGGDLFVLGVEWQPRPFLQPGWAKRIAAFRANGRFATLERTRVELRDEIRSSIVKLNRITSWAGHWGGSERRMNKAAVDRFIASDAFLELPLNDVLIQLGSRILSDRSRGLRDSDSSDISILSLAIPYCDLVVTDAYVASLSQELHLDEKYGLTITSAKTEGLHRAAAWLGNL